MYLVAIRSTISQAASPSSHSVTRPRTITGLKGLSGGASERATRGSRRRFRALRDSGPVKITTRSPSVPTKTGTQCGDPSGRTVARWATAVPSSRRRTSGSSTICPSLVDSVARAGESGCGGLAVMPPQPGGVIGHGVFDVVLRIEAGVRAQPGGVEVVVRRPARIAALGEGDVRAGHGGV